MRKLLRDYVLGFHWSVRKTDAEGIGGKELKRIAQNGIQHQGKQVEARQIVDSHNSVFCTDC